MGELEHRSVLHRLLRPQCARRVPVLALELSMAWCNCWSRASYYVEAQA